jgi:hypothetical protein
MTRRRRPLPIAAGLIAALLLGLWLLYPGIDARFIGTWVLKSSNGGTRTYHLHADGHGTKDVVSATWTGTVPFRWWVTRERLVIHYRSDNRLSDAHDYVRSIFVKFTGAAKPREIEEYEIIEMRPDAMQFRRAGLSEIGTFERLNDRSTPLPR